MSTESVGGRGDNVIYDVFLGGSEPVTFGVSDSSIGKVTAGEAGGGQGSNGDSKANYDKVLSFLTEQAQKPGPFQELYGSLKALLEALLEVVKSLHSRESSS
jgi:hypothetical protein